MAEDELYASQSLNQKFSLLENIAGNMCNADAIFRKNNIIRHLVKGFVESQSRPLKTSKR